MGIFPNPFSKSTTLGWTIPEPCEVKIQIMDLAGKPVVVPVNKRQRTGEYKIDYDSSGLATGIYFCHFTAGSIKDTQKLVVVR